MSVVRISAPILKNYEIAPSHRVITCFAPDIATAASPGHFVQVLASESYESILRKPFSIYSADPKTGQVSILFQVKGATTFGMAGKEAGRDAIDVLGPLGGAVFVPDLSASAKHVMVGGGYGVPPLVFLSRTLRERGFSGAIDVAIGARTRELLLCEKELKDIGVNVHCATEDGSYGVKGRVTEIVSQLVDAQSSVYTCGPSLMMRAVGEICEKVNANCQVSLEVSMACGVGVCMGCVIDLSDGKRVRACKEGPVFEFGKVRW